MKDKKTWIAVIVLVLLAAVLLSAYILLKPQPEEGLKKIEVEVIHGDGKTVTYEIETQAEFLYDAMREKGIVGELDDGFVSEVDGITADGSAQQWWCFSDRDVELPCGAAQYPICDGGHYEVTLKTGW